MTGAAGAEVGAEIGALIGWTYGVLTDADTSDETSTPIVHGNSAQSMRGTEVYYLINRSSGVIDKIGITSAPEGRYLDSFLRAENVYYETQAQYTWRYPAMVDENIRLTHYFLTYGDLPRLNRVTR